VYYSIVVVRPPRSVVEQYELRSEENLSSSSGEPEFPASVYYSIVVKEITHLTGREVENKATSCRFGKDPRLTALVSVCVSADLVIGGKLEGWEQLP
jgi:hypothetical protein